MWKFISLALWKLISLIKIIKEDMEYLQISNQIPIHNALTKKGYKEGTYEV